MRFWSSKALLLRREDVGLLVVQIVRVLRDNPTPLWREGCCYAWKHRSDNSAEVWKHSCGQAQWHESTSSRMRGSTHEPAVTMPSFGETVYKQHCKRASFFIEHCLSLAFDLTYWSQNRKYLSVALSFGARQILAPVTLFLCSSSVGHILLNLVVVPGS